MSLICGCIKNESQWVDLGDHPVVQQNKRKSASDKVNCDQRHLGLVRFAEKIAEFLDQFDVALLVVVCKDVKKKSDKIWERWAIARNIPETFELWSLIDFPESMKHHPIYKEYVHLLNLGKIPAFMTICYAVWKKYRSIPHQLQQIVALLIQCPDILAMFEITVRSRDTIQLLKWSPIDLINSLKKEKYVSSNQIDEQILQRVYNTAAKKSVLNLMFMPELINEKHAIQMVRKCGALLYGVPTEKRTVDVCRLAAINDCKLEDIPKNLRTAEIFSLFLSRNGKMLENVSENVMNEVLCRIAVSQNSESIRYVPKRFMNEDLCVLCLEKHNDAEIFAYIPEDMRSFKLCAIAVSRYNACWDIVPPSIDRVELDIQVNLLRKNNPDLPYDKRTFR
jgi:hypothetical protein